MKNKLVGERVYSISMLPVHHVGQPGQEQKQEQQQSPWRSVADHLTLTDAHSATFLIPPILCKLVIKKVAPQTCLQANLMGAVLQLRVPLPSCVKLITKMSHHKHFYSFLSLFSLDFSYLWLSFSL